MIVLLTAAAIVVVGLAVAFALGAFSGVSVQPADPTTSHGGHPLPIGGLTAHDIDELRFDVVTRGYRMQQVDEAIDRLRGRILDLEDELASHRSVTEPTAPHGQGPRSGKAETLPFPRTGPGGPDL